MGRFIEKNKKNSEIEKQSLDFLQSYEWKIVSALSTDEDTLIQIDELDAKINKLDDKIYNLLVAYLGGKSFYNNITELSKYSGHFSSPLMNVINNISVIANVISDNKAESILNNGLELLGASNISEIKSLLEDRESLEKEKQAIINNCVGRFDKMIQTEEMQNMIKMLSKSMIKG